MTDKGPFIFRLNDNGSGPNLLMQVCLERGWREYNEGSSIKDNWNLWWRTGGFSLNHYKQLKPWQFTNHIPKASCICRKDNLSRYLKCMKKVFGGIYDFSPEAYNLPLEYTKLVAECSRQNQGESQGQGHADVWICKPVGQSQGRGISIFKKLSELVYYSNAVVQRYVQNPLLIGGYKFDLRLYVCVPSFRPLTVYLYKEGLARFGTEKFSLNDLDNHFAHLTNSSLNKLGPRYTEMKERVGAGCKWSLRQLRHYLHQSGLKDWLLWQRISALVVLTVASQLHGIPPSNNCFEFYGFDVLVDSSLRPWLLEVNLSPALGNDCDVDPAVKKPMLHDMFDLLGLPVCNTGLSLFTIWSGETIRTISNQSSSSRSTTSIEDTITGEEEEEKTPISVGGCGSSRARSAPHTAVTVVTVANRWRRRGQPDQGRKKTAKTNHEPPPRPKTHRKPSATRIGAFLPTVNIGEEYHSPEEWATCNEIVTKHNGTKTYRRSKCSPSALWGNGRDWRDPPTKEGDWVRVYPLGQKALGRNTLWHDETPEPHTTMFGDKEIKTIVSNVSKCSKLAKEIFQKNPTVSDEERNALLMKNLGLAGLVWLPNN
ncbi:probable tubulin polyglutamylase TTLL2 isoform X1 [Macrosteles quadrilineatus]|uniref:probable tubulin polyglutamylase TTLL2 isoform X1 n=1 Tax=Macrosteles quadrilineatus TaxID=74068 RepID=UPI0023E0A49C|nr:probable tubulin polyglutamylase TTLL2 isoform X1 [Macrosteles quadrilineatus]